MNNIIKKERNIYFKNKKDYFISRITKEHNYLIWKYVYYLRKEEISKNKFLKLFWRRRKNILGKELGLLIYSGCCDYGLHIYHFGSIIINGYSKIGKNCVLHGQNCIGNNGQTNKAPIIGNNVDIGVGASIIGEVFIADNIKIGAGAVVTKSCYTKGATLIGIPAKEMK